MSVSVYHTLSRLISSTISGLTNVVISPKSDCSPSAILRRMRRIIFPERVFGNPVTNCILSSLAMAPIWSEISWLISFARFVGHAISRFL